MDALAEYRLTLGQYTADIIGWQTHISADVSTDTQPTHNQHSTDIQAHSTDRQLIY